MVEITVLQSIRIAAWLQALTRSAVIELSCRVDLSIATMSKSQMLDYFP